MDISKKNGFTLIEVILSLALIGLISVSVLGIFNSGLLNITRAGNRTEGTSKAQEDFVEDVVSYDNPVVTVVLPLSDDSTESIDMPVIMQKGSVIIDEGTRGEILVEVKKYIYDRPSEE
jgi:prepilin-type N-terminal cleavage/methylation domain-containing protein